MGLDGAVNRCDHEQTDDGRAAEGERQMGRVIEGQLWGEGYRFGIVVSRFNGFITEQLLAGALDGLRRHGVRDDDIDVLKVPGSFEIPVATKQLATLHRYHALICLGAVIRGATPHFDYVAGEVSKGIANVALDTGVPCIFGILTTETIEQAIDRAGTKMGNKGWEAAVSAVEMASLLAQLQGKW